MRNITTDGHVNKIIPTETLISAYSQGFFPMAEPEDGEIYWHSPIHRAVIPLDRTKLPRTIQRLFNNKEFEFTINHDFERVILECSNRQVTWISDEIINSYLALHKQNFAHSVEAWKGGVLAGGLYGVAIGGAFFGESMFTMAANASKSAFYYLKEHLINRGFLLLDSQYLNPHTQSLGAIEIHKSDYLTLLKKAISLNCKFD